MSLALNNFERQQAPTGEPCQFLLVVAVLIVLLALVNDVWHNKMAALRARVFFFFPTGSRFADKKKHKKTRLVSKIGN